MYLFIYCLTSQLSFALYGLLTPVWLSSGLMMLLFPASFDYRHLVEKTANCLPAPLPAPSVPRSLFLFRSLSQTARPFYSMVNSLSRTSPLSEMNPAFPPVPLSANS